MEPRPGTKGGVLGQVQCDKFSPTSLVEGRPPWFISPSAVAFSSSSPKQAYWAYLFCAVLWAYSAFAGMHSGPTTRWVSNHMQAALAQYAGFFIFLIFFALFIFVSFILSCFFAVFRVSL